MRVARGALRVVAGLGLAAAVSCAGPPVGRPYLEESEGGQERLEGVVLGSVASAAHLSKGWPHVPLIVLCSRSEAGRKTGNVFLATVVLAGAPFGFEQLVASGPGGERTFAGRVLRTDSRFGIGDRRYTERIEAPLSDDDVRWLVAAGAALELRMEGEKMWIKVPPGAPLAAALRAYREEQVPPEPAGNVKP